MDPRTSALLLAFSAAALAQGATPPPIPHPIDGYLVTRQENNCLECHDRPQDIGRKRQKDAPVPAPASHYGGKLDAKPTLASSFFNCTSCHVRR
jgi:nitrate reductase cytochrome c-type subunit